MDQVAHQAVVIQFILEMAANSQQDPRGCFRQFFSKAKVGTHVPSTVAQQSDVVGTNSFAIFFPHFPHEDGQDVYLEVFYAELEAFKRRLREHRVNCNRKVEPKEAWTSALPPVGPLCSVHIRFCFRPCSHRKRQRLHLLCDK